MGIPSFANLMSTIVAKVFSVGESVSYSNSVNRYQKKYPVCDTQGGKKFMCNDPVLLETDIHLPRAGRGKVRDIYDLGQNLLFVATDRISAFDCILGSGIPCKGRVLTQISLFWFDRLKNLVPSHVMTADPEQYPEAVDRDKEILTGRSMIVRKAAMIPVECVARGYLSGSGWKEYRATGTVCGIKLPAGLKESDRLPEPIFTPATKAQSGHDENVSFDHVASTIGSGLAARLRDLTLAIYEAARAYALDRGLILADTKFEFGFIGDQLVLADELLTPDSSRYWPADSYNPGTAQVSFDKQFVRDYLETVHWNKQPPAPSLPHDIAEKTKQKYIEAFERLTGRPL
jgi:phosphoribosylaminoimidazole-succinocarboxamide synthase